MGLKSKNLVLVLGLTWSMKTSMRSIPHGRTGTLQHSVRRSSADALSANFVGAGTRQPPSAPAGSARKHLRRGRTAVNLNVIDPPSARRRRALSQAWTMPEPDHRIAGIHEMEAGSALYESY